MEEIKIDDIIKCLKDIKRNGENINIIVNSGLKEAAKTVDDVYYKRYVDISIEFNDFIKGEKLWKTK